MTLNRKYFEKQIQRILNTAPSYVSVARYKFTSDGYGGRTKSKTPEVVTSSLKVIFDNSSAPNLSINASDAGRVFVQNSIKLWIPYEPTLDIQSRDIIQVKGSKRQYQVTEVTNILEQNLLIEVMLEVMD
jgi:hypothetical protein